MRIRKRIHIREELTNLWNYYLRSAWPCAGILLVVVFAWHAYEDLWPGLFRKYLLPLLDIQINFWTQLILWGGLIVLLAFYARRLRKKYVESLPHILVFLLAGWIYFSYAGEYSCRLGISGAGYTDILLAIILLYNLCQLLLSVMRNYRRIRTTGSFIPDVPVGESGADILDYREDASGLALYIRNEIPENVFCSIAVYSPWGSGKTSYINMVRESLGEDCIVIDFNPRLCKDTGLIQQEFFRALNAGLRPYSSGFPDVIDDYVQVLGAVEGKGILDSLYSFKKKRDREQEKERLQRVIFRLRRRIVVVVEELDRLLPGEVVEVFKLIGYNANFSNVVFLTAYDKNCLTSIMEGHVQKEFRFTDKFFDMEISLPGRPYAKVLDYLSSHIRKWDGIKDDFFYGNTELIRPFILNLRDAKRFVNGFNRISAFIDTEVLFEEYFYLQLIKFGASGLYDKLKNKEILSPGGRIYSLPKEYAAGIPACGEVQKKSLQKILQKLFPDDNGKYYKRHLREKNSFDIYFFEKVYGRLKIGDIKGLFRTGYADAYFRMQEWFDHGYGGDVAEYFGRLDELSLDIREFEMYARLSFAFPEYWEGADLVAVMNQKFADRKNAREKAGIFYGGDLGKYKTFLYGIFSDDVYPYPCRKYIKRLLLPSLKGEDDPCLFFRDELMALQLGYLKAYCSERTELDAVGMDIWQGCLGSYNPETRRYGLLPEANLLMRMFVRAHPGYYIKNFVECVILDTQTGWVRVAPEKWYDELFGSNPELQKFIGSPGLDRVKGIGRARNLWELYRVNGYKALQLGLSMPEDKIQTYDFSEEMAKLKYLLGLERKYNFILNSSKSTPEKNGPKLRQLLEEVNKAGLDVHKKYNLILKLTDDLNRMAAMKK